jgi:hypothetical protein
MRDAPNQIQGNNWVQHGLAPIKNIHIVCSCYEVWLIWRDIPMRDDDGAKLTWESVVDVGASSSSIPGNGARKLVAVLLALS